MTDTDLCPTPWCVLDPQGHQAPQECLDSIHKAERCPSCHAQRYVAELDERDDVPTLDLDGCMTRAAYVFVAIAFLYLLGHLLAAAAR